MLKKFQFSLFAVLAMCLGMLAGPANAAGAFDTLTAGISYVDVIAAVMAVALLLAGLYTTMRGVTMILGFIRRG